MTEWQNTSVGRIPSTWTFKKISDTDLFIGDGNYSSKYPRQKELLAAGIPFISSKDLQIGKIRYTNLRYISPKQHDTLLKGHIKEKDVLIVVRGNGVGDVALVDKRFEDANINAQLAFIRSQDQHFGPFLYYLLLNYKKRRVTETYVSGSAQPQITVRQLNSIFLAYPTLPEQKAIAAVLSSLDNKIDLLQRQNATLEAMAQTLFRQWFVEEADDDWDEKPLDEIADYLNGFACQKFPPENELEKLPVLKIKDLRGGITDQSDWATSKVEDKYLVENGDVIFSWSGSLMVKIWDGERCVLNQLLFKVTSEQYPKWFYYLWTVYHLQKFIAIAQSKATTMGHIKRKDISSSMVLVPSDNEMQEMTLTFESLFEKLILNNQQIRTLEKLRDTLLPKLMSGEVWVRM